MYSCGFAVQLPCSLCVDVFVYVWNVEIALQSPFKVTI